MSAQADKHVRYYLSHKIHAQISLDATEGGKNDY